MMTLGSHFEALRTHKNLVVTISEEKRLFEENLKLIMLRVNGMVCIYLLLYVKILCIQGQAQIHLGVINERSI